MSRMTSLCVVWLGLLFYGFLGEPVSGTNILGLFFLISGIHVFGFMLDFIRSHIAACISIFSGPCLLYAPVPWIEHSSTSILIALHWHVSRKSWMHDQHLAHKTWCSLFVSGVRKSTNSWRGAVPASPLVHCVLACVCWLCVQDTGGQGHIVAFIFQYITARQDQRHVFFNGVWFDKIKSICF